MIPDPHADQNQPGDTLFRDVLSLTLLGFLAVIVMLLPHINPEGAETASKAPAPGNVVVEITWPNDINADVDLWVRAPNDISVGYSNKGGVIFNLLRDDLGKVMDISPNNSETAYTRGVVPGEYVVNAHLYRADGLNPPPTLVQTVVSVKRTNDDGDPYVVPVVYSTAKLKFEGEETTLVRFELNAEGDLVKDSVHSVFQKLRTTTGSK